MTFKKRRYKNIEVVIKPTAGVRLGNQADHGDALRSTSTKSKAFVGGFNIGVSGSASQTTGYTSPAIEVVYGDKFDCTIMKIKELNQPKPIGILFRFPIEKYSPNENSDYFAELVATVDGKKEDSCRVPMPTPTPNRNGSAFSLRPGGRALAIGSHWDDSLLGCLGSLIKLSKSMNYEVDMLVVCTNHNDHYYGAEQPHLDTSIKTIYETIGSRFGFSILSWRELLESARPALNDRELVSGTHHIRTLLEGVNSKEFYDLVFIPPIDDLNEDHAIVGRLAFSVFRKSGCQVLEYLIKRYTDVVFNPNLSISLDGEGPEAPYQLKVAALSVVREEVRNADRHFSKSALEARMISNGLDATRSTQFAEIFRTRLEV